MPKYYDFKICGYYLYFTAHCIIECMHVHASDRKLTEGGSAKFFVKSNGDTVIQNRPRGPLRAHPACVRSIRSACRYLAPPAA